MVNDFYNDKSLKLDDMAPVRGNEILSEVAEKTDKDINVHKATEINFLGASEGSIKLVPGSTFNLKVEAKPFLANIQYPTFESSNLKVIQIIDNVAYACQTGNATITCTTMDGLVSTLNVTVEENSNTEEDEKVEFISPTLPEKIYSGDEVNVTVGFTSNKSFTGVKFVFSTEGPGDVNYTISDGEGHDFSFVNNGDWGGDGFDITVEPDQPYLAYTPLKAVFSVEGEYAVKVSLIKVEDSSTVSELNIPVTVLKKEEIVTKKLKK